MGLALKDHQYHCYGDYLNWPDDVRYELIDGDAYLMAPAPDLAHQDVTGSHQVIQGGQPGIKLDILESARQPQFRGAVGADAGDAFFAEKYLSGLRFIKTVDAVEQAGFPGAVRADDG